jgi:hypothetical protein
MYILNRRRQFKAYGEKRKKMEHVKPETREEFKNRLESENEGDVQWTIANALIELAFQVKEMRQELNLPTKKGVFGVREVKESAIQHAERLMAEKEKHADPLSLEGSGVEIVGGQ